jgi:hypothetical protein
MKLGDLIQGIPFWQLRQYLKMPLIIHMSSQNKCFEAQAIFEKNGTLVVSTISRPIYPGRSEIIEYEVPCEQTKDDNTH